MTNSWLAHHGIIGQKWGIRRYQDKDGYLTDEGRKRYAAELQRNLQKKKENRADPDSLKDPNKWYEDDLRNRKNVADSARNVTTTTKDAISSLNISKNKPRLDLSKMSDNDLRNAINREELELKYNRLFNSPTESKGKEYVMNALTIGGAAIGVAASAVNIALAVQQLRGANGGTPVKDGINPSMLPALKKKR